MDKILVGITRFSVKDTLSENELNVKSLHDKAGDTYCKNTLVTIKRNCLVSGEIYPGKEQKLLVRILKFITTTCYRSNQTYYRNLVGSTYEKRKK